ncbi:hypothetical protein HD806DRAFT_548521 [Xylariaceae sp. AK1471]|nr:hypothetical protein HD806DRAFT_548521 [Xylariaceae sp. AK1471]
MDNFGYLGDISRVLSISSSGYLAVVVDGASVTLGVPLSYYLGAIAASICRTGAEDSGTNTNTCSGPVLSSRPAAHLGSYVNSSMPTLIVFLSSLLDTRLATTVHSATVNMSPRALLRRLVAQLPAAAAAAAAVTPGSAQECTFETFTSILADDPDASINFAVPVPADGSFG